MWLTVGVEESSLEIFGEELHNLVPQLVLVGHDKIKVLCVVSLTDPLEEVREGGEEVKEGGEEVRKGGEGRRGGGEQIM